MAHATPPAMQLQTLLRPAGVVAIVLGLFGLLAPEAARTTPAPSCSRCPIPPTLTGSDITITAQEADVPIFAGTPTTDVDLQRHVPGSDDPAPHRQAHADHFQNNLPAAAGSLSFHNHGNHSSPENDGQPTTFLVPPGGSRNYHYTGLEDGKNERGAMQWYHDHRDGVTARNVWMGLAGLYILDDPDDPQTLPVRPAGRAAGDHRPLVRRQQPDLVHVPVATASRATTRS